MAAIGKAIRRFRGRRAAVGALLIAWLMVVVVGAGAEPGSDNWIGLPTLSWLNIVLVAVAALGAILFIALIFSAMRGPAERGPDRAISLRSILLALVVVWLLSGRVAPDEGERTEADSASATEPVDAGQSGDGAGATGLEQDELVVLLGILCIAGAVVLVSRRRLAADAEPLDPSREQALGSAIDEARAALLVGDDHRSAVLRAYQGLEEAMDRQGMQREWAETPTEHLARVLADLPIDPGPVLRLGQLYQIARFSDHPVTGADRQNAAEALTEVGRQLAVST
jgi:hypothetical protein